MVNATTAANNVAVGFQALSANTTGGGNTAIGKSALDACTTGGNNVAVGISALTDLSDQSSCTAIGVLAGENAVGQQNCFLGFQAGQGASSGCNGTDNVAVGKDAMLVMTSASHNTVVGREAGSNLTSGTNNLLLGKRAGTSSSPAGTMNNENNIICLGDNSIVTAHVKVDWTVGSDQRDKTDIQDITTGLSFVNQLKPKSFWFTTERGSDEKHGDKKYGFLAQDILALEGSDPVVINNKDENSLKYQGSHLIPILVNAIKELSTKVTALEAG